MRKLLLTTVAAAAVVGVAGLASAQTTQSPATQAPAGGSAAKSESTEHQTPGAMGGALKGNINGSGAAKSAQAPAQGTKPDQKLGQDQEKQTTPQRGAQEDKSGAQEQRGAQDENTKSGATADEQNTGKTKGSGGGAVQLSQTQRSKIQAVIGGGHAARVTTNVNFDVAVGVRVPRSVHVEVLPADIVEIVPQFEGFDYIVVGDNILIIDPDTLEIVDVIPV
jgi:hypothetical protein